VSTMRIRTVKPELFLHDGLFDLERETGLPIRLAFIGLWCAADREGRFRWQPRRLKALILPYDDVDFSRVLDALATRGFVVRYASGRDELGWIPGFSRHQVINNREKASELPTPPIVDANQSVIETSTRERRVNDACGTRHDLAQAEGKGKEGNKEYGREQDTHPSPPSGSEHSLSPSPPRDPSVLAILPPNLDTEEFRAAWEVWIEHRIEKGLGVTSRQVAMLFERLARIGSANAVTAIKHSVSKGWDNIYTPEETGGRFNNQQHTPDATTTTPDSFESFLRNWTESQTAKSEGG
jgi:hypothetical protein